MRVGAIAFFVVVVVMVLSLLSSVLHSRYCWLSEVLSLLRSWNGGVAGVLCCSRTTATTELIVRQRGVVSELINVIPTAIPASETLEREMSVHLPPGDSLSTTLSSPQFSQALSMFWSALQSGQAGPVVQQFGLGNSAVSAATTGNLEEFVTAMETEGKSSTNSPQEEAKKDPPGDKKDDDDEGMTLD